MAIAYSALRQLLDNQEVAIPSTAPSTKEEIAIKLSIKKEMTISYRFIR